MLERRGLRPGLIALTGLALLLPATAGAATTSGRLVFASTTICTGQGEYTVGGSGTTRTVDYTARIDCNLEMGGTAVEVAVQTPTGPEEQLAFVSGPGDRSTSVAGTYTTTPGKLLVFETTWDGKSWQMQWVPVRHDSWVPVGCYPGNRLEDAGWFSLSNGTQGSCSTRTVVTT